MRVLLSLFANSLMMLPLIVFASDKSSPPLSVDIFKHGDWTSSGPWGGGYVQNVVLCPSDPKRCYAYIDIGGVSRSDDGGKTWRCMNRSLPISCSAVRSLSVDPRNADELVVVSGNWPGKWEELDGIYKSSDGGLTFKRVQDVFGFGGNEELRYTGLVLTRSPENPDVILAASSESGVWRSNDNGASWQCVGLKGLHPTDIRFDLANAKRLWACSPKWSASGKQPRDYETGLFRSDDGGSTWKKLSELAPTEMLQDPSDTKRLFGIFDEQHVRLSVDGGEEWTDFSKGLPAGERYTDTGSKKKARHGWAWCVFRFNALAAASDFILTANANGDFFRLDKGTDIWTPVQRKRIDSNGWWAVVNESQEWTHFGKALCSITVDPLNPRHWFLSDWYSVWQTYDAGESWHPTTVGMAQTAGRTIASDFFAHDTVYLGMCDNGLFRSDDRGETWTWKRKPGFNDITSIAPSPAAPGMVYACGGWLANVHLSRDTGRTWERPACKGLPAMERGITGVYSIAADAKDPMKAYACVGSTKPGLGGIYETSNNGESWTKKSRGIPEFCNLPGAAPRPLFPYQRDDETGRHDVASSKDGSLVAISKFGKAVFRWDANSDSWEKVLSDITPVDLAADPFEKNRFLMAAYDSLLVSEDGGRSWYSILDVKAYKQLLCPDGKWFMAGRVALDPQVRGRIAVVAQDTVFLSVDGGRTWGTLDKSIPDRGYNRIPAFQGGRLLIETRVAGVFWLDLATAKITPLSALRK